VENCKKIRYGKGVFFSIPFFFGAEKVKKQANWQKINQSFASCKLVNIRMLQSFRVKRQKI
jgi:hypothetical protein